MSVEATEYLYERMAANATAPIVIVEHSFSGVLEYASCTGDIQYDGKLYPAGGCDVKAIKDSVSATVDIAVSSDRLQSLDNGTWRNGACRIYYIPGLPDEGIVPYEVDDAILMVDGLIISAAYSRQGKLTFGVMHVNYSGKLSPRHTWDAVSNHCPAAGTEVVWEGDRYILQGRETDTNTKRNMKPVDLITGLPASTLHRLSQPPEMLVTATGAGTPIKLIYGTAPVGGDIIALGAFGSSLVMAVGWGYGPVKEITKLFINDEEILPGGTPGTDVTFTHYLGEYNQPVDLGMALSLAGFADNFVLDLPEGLIGCAYTIVAMPPSTLSSSPTFKALIDGLCIHDPRLTGESDPEYLNDVFAISFSNPQDVSSLQLPFTLNEEVTIEDSQLVCSAGGYLHVPYDASMQLPINTSASMSIRFTLGPVGTEQYIACSALNPGMTNRGWSLVLAANGTLRFYISINGTTNASGYPRVIKTGMVAGENHVVTWIKDGASGVNTILLDGVVVHGYSFTSGYYNDGASGIVLGAHSDGVTTSKRFFGKIDFFRMTINGWRLTDTAGYSYSALPFPEYGQFSDTSILCGADLIRNPFYGLGMDVVGLADAADWNEELRLSFERARLSLVLSTTQDTSSYIDLLVGEYGECFWYPENRCVVVKKNAVANILEPTGQQVIANSSFDDDDSNWDVSAPGVGHVSIGSGLLSVLGTQGGSFTVGQPLSVDIGATYVLYINADVCTAEGYAVRADAEVLLGKATIVGVRFATFIPTTDTVTLEMLFYATGVVDVTEIVLYRLYWKEGGIVAGSLRIEGVSENNTPNVVKTKYIKPSTSSPNWPVLYGAEVSRTGVVSGDIDALPTTLYLEGIFRSIEAKWKAQNKLARYYNRMRYSWVTTDAGIRHRKGDIVEVDSVVHGIKLIGRIMETEMVSYGRYAVTADRYSDAQHPTAFIDPVVTGEVPVGFIVPLAGAVAPAGWDLYTLPNGNLIVGAGDEYAVGSSGGSATHPGLLGNSTTDDAHEAGDGAIKRAIDYIEPRPTEDPTSHLEILITPPGDTSHYHAFDTGEIVVDPLRREQRLMIKTGTAGAQLPKEAQVFGVDGLTGETLQRILVSAGRLFQASNSQGNVGSSTLNIPVGMATAAMHHKHYTEGSMLANHEPWEDYYASPLLGPYYEDTDTFNHLHFPIGTVDRSIKKIALPLYGSNEDYDLVPGMYGFWAGAIGSLPTDFVLADGTNGTHDCRNYFIEISTSGSEGVFGGNNTIELRATTTDGGHKHFIAQLGFDTAKRYLVDHTDLVFHTHTVEASDDWTPNYYALAVIMYNP